MVPMIPVSLAVQLSVALVVSGLLALEVYAHPPTWVQLSIWLPATLVMTLGLLPFVKGTVMAAIYCANRVD